MPAHTTLTATPAGSAHALSAASLATAGGTYPSSVTYPASDDYPGRGTDLVASQVVPSTDEIPATVPFTIQTGSRRLNATPIT